MMIRTCLLIAVLYQLSACVAVPRLEFTDKLDFKEIAPEQHAMSYNDLLCCYDCNA